MRTLIRTLKFTCKLTHNALVNDYKVLVNFRELTCTTFCQTRAMRGSLLIGRDKKSLLTQTAERKEFV
jgi:hypothetical protein